MKKLITILVFVLALSASFTILNAQVWTLDFETTGGYTTNVGEFTDGGYDFFTRTDGSNIGSAINLSNMQGSYWFGADDTDGDANPTYLTLTIDDINISGQSNLSFQILLAEDDASDGLEDWDGTSYLHISYDIDNSGTFTNLLWVESTGTNSEPQIDTNFDGTGDGAAITDIFTQFTASIAGTGSVIDIFIEMDGLNAGEEDIAFDDLNIVSGTVPLVVDFLADETAVGVGTTVNFTDLTTGGTPPYSYEWDLDGDGQFDDSTDPNPSFTYTTAGIYDVALRVTDDDLTVDTETKTAYISVFDIANLVFTEIHYNPATAQGSDADYEFLEIYNAGTSAVNLENYYFTQGITYTFLAGSSIAAGEYIILAYNELTYTGNGYQVFQWSGGLSNGGEDIELRDNNGVVIDYVNYDDAYPWATAPDGYGPSLSLIDISSDNNQLESWTASLTNEGSPGSANDFTGNATTTWTSGTGYDNWGEPNNWSNGTPGTTTDVTVPAGVSPGPKLDRAGSWYHCNDITINAGGQLTVNQPFNVAGDMLLESGASGTASLVQFGAGDIIISGSITTERFLSQGAWHYVANPIDDANTGVYTGLYMMFWDEPGWFWNWVLSADSTLAVDMQGYAIWSEGSDATVTYTGALNTGSKTIGLTNTPGTPDPDDFSGFNLIGNPYPSPVNWNNNDGNGWTRTNLDNAIWIWNQSAGNYGTYVKDASAGTNGVDSIIPQNQGFFVHCNDLAGGSLTVDDAAREHSTKDILKESNSISQYLIIGAEGNNYTDEIIVNVNPLSSFDFDNPFDATKRRGLDEAPQAYTIASDQSELSINSIPEVTNETVIALGFEVGVDGIYKLALKEVEGFENTQVYLEDLKENQLINISEELTYSFTSETSDEPERFLLHFGIMTGNDELIESDAINIYSFNKSVFVNYQLQSTADIMVYDITGRLIVSKTINKGLNEIEINTGKGYYFVKVISPTDIQTQKVLLK
jgi:PKD repeat protein